MGVETATTVADLVSTNPVNTDNLSQGDDHIRLIKACLQATFPNADQAFYLSETFVDIASAATCAIGGLASQAANITGTTTITSFGTIGAGIWRFIKFAGALTLTHNATSLILPGGANITTAAGDVAIAMSLGSGNWIVLSYSRGVAGLAATTSNAGVSELATTAETMTGTDTVRTVTPSGLAASGRGKAIGELAFFPHETVPSGFLECNGAAVSRATYAALFTAISTRYGTGDGSTTFNLPDYRGWFLRGWDHGAGKDPDAASRTNAGGGSTGDHVGTKQSDQFKAHTHDVNGLAAEGSNVAPTGGNGKQYAARQDTTSTSAGGNETRPANINVMICIYAGA